MRKPTIGRTVHYQSFGTPNGEYLPEARAAIITAVHEKPGEETTVSLHIMNPTGLFFTSGVKYSEEPKSGCWSFPPIV